VPRQGERRGILSTSWRRTPCLGKILMKTTSGIEGGKQGIEIDRSEGDVASYFKQGKRRFLWKLDENISRKSNGGIHSLGCRIIAKVTGQ
jgi:hypothetical protein